MKLEQFDGYKQEVKAVLIDFRERQDALNLDLTQLKSQMIELLLDLQPAVACLRDDSMVHPDIKGMLKGTSVADPSHAPLHTLITRTLRLAQVFAASYVGSAQQRDEFEAILNDYVDGATEFVKTHTRMTVGPTYEPSNTEAD